MKVKEQKFFRKIVRLINEFRQIKMMKKFQAKMKKKLQSIRKKIKYRLIYIDKLIDINSKDEETRT